MLWASDLGNGHYKLENIPLQDGVSYQDVVEAVFEDDGMLTFKRVVKKSGHRTIHVSLEQNATKEFTDSIIALGCSIEGAIPTFLSIDIPPAIELGTVTNHLTDMGVEWEYGDPTYEQAHSGDRNS